MKREMNAWQSMANKVIRQMKVLDPEFTARWWATKPWSKHPTLIPGARTST